LSLQELIAHLGLDEVARRAGVTAATLRRWLSRGIPPRAADALAGIIRRHLAGIKGAETRRKAQEFRDSITAPPNTELPDNKVKPPAPPESVSITEDGTSPYDTDRYTGEVHVLTLGQPVHEVDFDALGSYVRRIFVHSRRHYIQVRFLLFRYVTPGSPGKGGLATQRGKWSEFWASTHVHGSEEGIENEVATMSQEGPEVGHESLEALANRRIIWLEQVHIHTFDDTNKPTELSTIVTRELR
jgi:hypothetical protein